MWSHEHRTFNTAAAVWVYLALLSTISCPYVTIEGKFLPQSTDPHNAILRVPKLTPSSTRIGTDEEENTYAAAGMRGLACFSFALRHTSCAVEGRDLRPSAVVLGFCGWGLWNKTTSIAKKWGASRY